jgi:hypothetical protein
MSVYLLLDGARVGSDTEFLKVNSVSRRNLFIGEVGKELEDVAPLLFDISEDIKVSDWFFEKGWGNSCGILMVSSVGISKLFVHFRKYLIVDNEYGGQLYFRYYDPRVFNIFLDSCDSVQLSDFFAPIDSFIVESNSDERACVYSISKEILSRGFMNIEEVKSLVTYKL